MRSTSAGQLLVCMPSVARPWHTERDHDDTTHSVLANRQRRGTKRAAAGVYCAHTSRFTQGPPLPPSLSLPCLLTFIVHQLHSQCVSAPFHKLLQSPHVHHLWAGEPLGAWQGTWKMKSGDVSKTADCAMLFPIITVQIRVTNDFWLPRQLILSASQQSPPLETLASPGGRVVSGRMPFGSRWLF